MTDIEISMERRIFTVSIVGVTHENSDGSSRQQIISRAKAGDAVKFVREYQSEFDPLAVAILNSDGKQIGYLPKGDRLASHIDSGGEVKAKVKKVVGGPTLFDRIFGKKGKSYGCVLEIEKGDFDWSIVNPLLEESSKIEKVLVAAKKHEESDVDKAIGLYRKATSMIREMDARGRLAACWRRARNPVNRLSLLLEKKKDYPAALQAILDYEKDEDRFGLLKADIESVEKRKLRLAKKLHGKPSTDNRS